MIPPRSALYIPLRSEHAHCSQYKRGVDVRHQSGMSTKPASMIGRRIQHRYAGLRRRDPDALLHLALRLDSNGCHE